MSKDSKTLTQIQSDAQVTDGAGLPSAFYALPAPSPLCFFPRIQGVDFSVQSCHGYDKATNTVDQPFEHCEYCQCWNGEWF